MALIQNEIEIKSWWLSLQDASCDDWVGNNLPVVRESDRQNYPYTYYTYNYTYPCWIPITILIPISIYPVLSPLNSDECWTKLLSQRQLESEDVLLG